MRDSIQYSEAFKLQVVREVEEGKHASCWAAREAYGIRGSMTVARWVREYGKSHLLGKVVHVQSPGERSEVRKLKDRVVVLEKALVDAHLDLRLERAYLEIACEEGWKGSVDELKKKGGGLPPIARSRQPKG
jgi:transposase-like protein